MRWRCLAPWLATLLAGCVTTPSFDRITGVTPKTVVDVIQCELATAKTNLAKAVDLRPWTAVADLTLQVDEEATLAPGFTHTPTKTFAFDWGLKGDTQATRIYNETITFKIGGLDQRKACADAHAGITLNGNLGLEEVIKMAFLSVPAGSNFVVGEVPEIVAQDATSAAPVRPRAADAAVAQGLRRGSRATNKREGPFGTSIEFVLIAGIGPTGPTWTLEHFRGPGKMFSANRTDTQKVVISFAYSENGQSAASIARTMNATINLQSLSSSLRALRTP